MTAVMPLSQEARRAYMARLDSVERTELPAPGHTSRDPWPDGLNIPRGILTLKLAAEQFGWSIALTYARGPYLPRNRSVHTIRHSIAVRCHRSTLITRTDLTPLNVMMMRAVAFYESADRKTWKYSGSLVAGGPAGLFASCNVTEFREYLELDIRGQVPPEFFSSIRERLESAKTRAKTAAASRPKKAREVHA